MISRISGVLSASPGWVPRAVHAWWRGCAAQIAAGRKGQKRLDRRAREADDVLPAEAALFGRVAPRRCKQNRAGRRDRPRSSTSRHSRSSCNTFWPNKVCNVASRSASAAMRACWSGPSSAPLRTKRRWWRSRRRSWSRGEPQFLGAPGIKIGDAREQPRSSAIRISVLRALWRKVAGDRPERQDWASPRIEVGKNPAHPGRAAARCSSRASTVSAKLGGHDAPATAAISASCSPCRGQSAGGKCPGRMRSKGRMPNGVSQVSKNGLSVMSAHRALLRNAAANVGVPTARGPVPVAREPGNLGGLACEASGSLESRILPAKEQCSRSLADVLGKAGKSSFAGIGREAR